MPEQKSIPGPPPPKSTQNNGSTTGLLYLVYYNRNLFDLEAPTNPRKDVDQRHMKGRGGFPEGIAWLVGRWETSSPYRNPGASRAQRAVGPRSITFARGQTVTDPSLDFPSHLLHKMKKGKMAIFGASGFPSVSFGQPPKGTEGKWENFSPFNLFVFRPSLNGILF